MAMTAQLDRRRALYDAYCAVPEHQRAEVIDGTLYVSPRPAPRHANATSVLGGELNGAFQRGRGGPGGWILDEPENECRREQGAVDVNNARGYAALPDRSGSSRGQ